MPHVWTWVATDVAVAAHAEQLAEHGGGEGVRDGGLLESAMARPQNLAAYGEPDAADLAAAYAFGIARNHPFVDGNKRTAVVVSETFLALNGRSLGASDAELVVAFLALAAGELSEVEMADWFRGHLNAVGSEQGSVTK
ncbi:MAG: type II toxin-antitoxin system death-on-curing family toxin [Sphingomonas sp.]|nr:type II toxin-antitoxin system death-on-curing family toxin [Sphingomonas sp.]